MKNLLFSLMTIITISLYGTPTTYIVTKGITTNVTCNIGDTLKFYGNSPTGYGVSINSTPVISVHPCMTSPYYIGYYVIVGGETSFTINSSVNWTGTLTVNTTTGVLENINKLPLINVFPNPFVDVLKITTSKNTVVTIFTPSGQLIMIENIQEGITDFNLTNLPSGIYFVKVGNTTRRLVKE